MSGIAGIWNFDGRPVESSLLSELIALLAHRGDDGEGRWLGAGVAFAFQNNWITPESVHESQPIVRPGECVALFDGRLDNRAALLADLQDEARVSPTSSDALLVSASYRKYGERFAERLNGDFAVAIFDLRRKRLLLARDAIGVRPLYFAAAGGSCVIASEVKAILAHPAIAARPNADMLAAALLACFGQERDGLTFYEGVSSVLPGQLVTVAPEGITKRTYWDFGIPQPIRLSSFADYAEAFREHFERAVARRLRSAFPVAVSVSGGLDSSSIYCTAESLRRRGALPCPNVVGISLEVDGDQADERAFLDDIEQKYERPIQRIPTTTQFVAGSLHQTFWEAEAPYFRGALNATQPFASVARAHGARIHLSGTWGDQMVADNTYLIDFARQFRWATVAKHLAERAKWNTAIPLPRAWSWFLKDFARYHCPEPLWRWLRNSRRDLTSSQSWFTGGFRARARRAEVAQRFRSPYKTARQKSIYSLVRPMYYAQALESANKIGAVHKQEGAYPFLDRDLILFLLAVPAGIVCAGGVPKAILRAAMRDILPSSIAQRRWKAQVTTQLGAAMNSRFSTFSRCLHANPLSVHFGFVREASLRAALPALQSSLSARTPDALWQFGDIFGLEIWLQAFFGGGARPRETEEPRSC